MPAKRKSASTGSKKPAAKKVKVEEENEEEVKVAKSARAKGAKGKSAKGSTGKSVVKTEEGSTEVRRVLKKGAAPVDAECTSMIGKAHVYTEGSDIYDAMLNQTNLSNNNNKYYVMQVLEEDSAKRYSVWFRWGRVGKKGQNSLMPCGSDLERAKDLFIKKFSDKTKNEWALRKKFVKVSGKYDLVEMDYSGDGADGDSPDAGPSKPLADVPESKLDSKVQDLVNLICDVKTWEDAVIEMKYDAKKAPLGKLKASQVKAGYAALKKVAACIDAGKKGAPLIAACDEFYTRIPHDFGMRRPPVIASTEEVKEKMALLEALDDIEVGMKVLSKGSSSENPVDATYAKLNCAMQPVDPKTSEYKVITDYVQKNHADTHSHYKLQILDMFDVSKDGEQDRFVDYGNRVLLWHGSRLSNWAGILSQGLRIAPPEAPVTGYMFGKGLYFADMSSKSANYCYPTRAKDVGLILLSEVSLGEVNELLAADFRADKLPSGKHSVKGVGAVAPDPKTHVKLSDGTHVPVGKGINTGIKNPSGYTLNYNEFIVYNTSQVRMRYLLKVKFNFK